MQGCNIYGVYAKVLHKYEVTCNIKEPSTSGNCAVPTVTKITFSAFIQPAPCFVRHYIDLNQFICVRCVVVTLLRSIFVEHLLEDAPFH